MIVWQLINVLSGNSTLVKELTQFTYLDSLPEDIVIKFLSQSDEVFSICSDGNLRSRKENYAFDIGVLEELSAVKAYEKCGGTALSEVIDYGSWKIPSSLL